jgi:MFS family permease
LGCRRCFGDPSWVCALGAAFSLPRLADRTGRRREIAAGALVAAGFGIVASVTAGSSWLGLLGLCFAAIEFIAAQPIFWALASGGPSGVTAAASIADQQLRRDRGVPGAQCARGRRP